MLGEPSRLSNRLNSPATQPITEEIQSSSTMQKIEQLINKVVSQPSSSESAPDNFPHIPGVSGHPDTDAGHDLAAHNKLGYRALDRSDSEGLQDETSNGFDYLTERSGQRIHAAESSSGSDDLHSEMSQILRDKLITSANGKKFLPLDQLEAIVTESAVQSLLDKVFSTESPSAHDICFHQESQDGNNRTQNTSRRKIFATLVLISRVKLIRDFIKEDINDTHLPLEQRKIGSETFLVARGVTSKPHSEYALRQGRGRWTCNDIALFCDQQWAISVPYFAKAEDSGEKVHFYSLSSHDILPFVKPGTDDRGDEASLNQGFFSTVRRVKIHKAHHNFPVAMNNHNGADFAVKKLTRSPNPSAGNHKHYFELEVEALKKFCQRNERYIIKLLATYEIDGQYHLLFPVADGNLMDLWKTSLNTGPPTGIPRASLWLAQECLGIAQALGKIHQFTFSPPRGASLEPSEIRRHGIHGDIKPQNVLWFRKLPGHLQDCDNHSTASLNPEIPDLGFLQLSDFGTVYFHRDSSIVENEILVKNNSYRAPESDLQGRNGSPALDIWAFGCLYLDLITWFLCGFDAVDQEFPVRRTEDEPEPGEEGIPQQDTFFICKRHWFRRKDVQVVKPNVIEWIERLHKHPKCSQFFHEFLNLIEAHMLVVAPKDRAKCTEVVGELQRLKANCDENSAYYENGKPRRSVSLPFPSPRQFDPAMLGNREAQSSDVTTEDEWKRLFEDVCQEKDVPVTCTPVTSVILGSRSIKPLEKLGYLPFSRPIFEDILKRFFVHDSVARTIFRNYTGTFSRTHLQYESVPEAAIVYTCRSSAHWENDLALSATYFPDTGSIFAVFYGCNDHSAGKTIMTRIANRIAKSSEDGFCHPMLLVGVFAEIERARMRELVLNAKVALQDVIDEVQINGYKSISRSTSPAHPWLNVYEIRNGLDFWAKLLIDMISHIDELDQGQYYCSSRGERFCKTGRRIKDRLREIHLEYGGLIKDCDMIIDGMTLATNLALARDNMNDGKQMKSIALVTMIFLPATFVATFFSMTLIKLGPGYIWLYPSVTIPLTVVVLSAYWVIVVQPWREKRSELLHLNGNDGRMRGTGYCCWV
ncbi:hypothetical protein O1611_g1547 [Lasiodiplodia mahajangana]|uniref:Uncharacterized protein n=1 Tax=Lasiodiplodia mahajangana TaxID=1108764 RepID=A0ACC2JXL6_9PEZI|nr:hypothetical protein O1611_g1547 [Lasiodiplodia mahajangana]